MGNALDLGESRTDLLGLTRTQQRVELGKAPA